MLKFFLSNIFMTNVAEVGERIIIYTYYNLYREEISRQILEPCIHSMMIFLECY